MCPVRHSSYFVKLPCNLFRFNFPPLFLFFREEQHRHRDLLARLKSLEAEREEQNSLGNDLHPKYGLKLSLKWPFVMTTSSLQKSKSISGSKRSLSLGKNKLRRSRRWSRQEKKDEAAEELAQPDLLWNAWYSSVLGFSEIVNKVRNVTMAQG